MSSQTAHVRCVMRRNTRAMSRVTAALALLQPVSSFMLPTISSRGLNSMRKMGGSMSAVCEAVPARVLPQPQVDHAMRSWATSRTQRPRSFEFTDRLPYF